MFSLRQTVVMAVAIIGFAAAQTCTSLSTGAYSNSTGCSTVLGYVSDLCSCTGSAWNDTTSSCTWSTTMFSGNCSGAAACLNTYSAAVNTFTSDSISDSTCSNDFMALHTCMVSLQSGTDSLWNASGMYAACTTYADTIFTGTTGGSCAANDADACPNPLSVVVYFTFGGNWSVILAGSSRRARARAHSAAYTNVVNAIMSDIANAIGYTPTMVTLQLTADDTCLATITLPISNGAKDSFLAVYGDGGSAATALFADTAYWFTAGGGIGAFTFVGAGTSPTPLTPTPETPTPGTPTPGTPAPTPSPSGASVATVANVLLALLALVLVA